MSSAGATVAPRRGGIRREAAWIGAGQVLAIAGTLVGVRLLTEVLDPVAYGRVAIGMTLVTLAQIGLMGPLGSVAQRFWAPAVESDAVDAYLRALGRAVLRAATLTLSLCVIVIAVSTWFGDPVWSDILAAAALFAGINGVNAVLSGVQNAARQRAVVALHRAVDQWLRYGIAALLVITTMRTASAVFLGYLASALLVLGSQLYFFRRRIQPYRHQSGVDSSDEVRNRLRQMVHYGWPMAVYGMFAWAQGATDRLALEAFAGTAAVGLYAPIYQLGYAPVIVVTNAVSQLFGPVIFQRAGDGTESQRLNAAFALNRRLVMGVLGVTALVVVIWAVWHRPLFALLVGREYVEVSYLMPWALLGGGLYATGQVAMLNVLSRMESRSLLLPRISTALLGIAMSFTGAALWGVEGVVAGQVVFGAAFLVWMLIDTRLDA